MGLHRLPRRTHRVPGRSSARMTSTRSPRSFSAPWHRCTALCIERRTSSTAIAGGRACLRAGASWICLDSGAGCTRKQQAFHSLKGVSLPVKLRLGNIRLRTSALVPLRLTELSKEKRRHIWVPRKRREDYLSCTRCCGSGPLPLLRQISVRTKAKYGKK